MTQAENRKRLLFKAESFLYPAIVELIDIDFVAISLFLFEYFCTMFDKFLFPFTDHERVHFKTLGRLSQAIPTL